MEIVDKSVTDGELVELLAGEGAALGVEGAGEELARPVGVQDRGAAQRHHVRAALQLRGRVGRGDKQGSCVLLWKPPLSETAKTRLDAVRRNDDGFAIAEIDFKLRGAGDMLGTQQSGLPPFRLVSPEAHSDLLGSADKEARLAVERDPELKSPRGRAIRLALTLFGYAEAAELARSG